ncbi:MAG TPA: hypothetical protein VLE99_03585 [Candidatus Saccharimonadales bacterium]|nr:hypothetical protein [Candidatus Saccharimonadales bacterium]
MQPILVNFGPVGKFYDPAVVRVAHKVFPAVHVYRLAANCFWAIVFCSQPVVCCTFQALADVALACNHGLERVTYCRPVRLIGNVEAGNIGGFVAGMRIARIVPGANFRHHFVGCFVYTLVVALLGAVYVDKFVEYSSVIIRVNIWAIGVD